MNDIYDVAVIGYGPIGATLANLLERQGLRVVVIEQFPDLYPLPRATHIDGEALRILQTAGVADALSPNLGIYSRMRFEDADGAMLIDWPRSVEPGIHGWRDSNRFHQPDLEIALRERAARSTHIDVRAGWKVTGITEDDDAVTIATVAPDGASENILARFAVGCDGARSTVRQVIGADVETLAPSAQWLVADFILNPNAPDLPEGTVQYCDPARPFTYIEAVGRRRRWEVMLLPGDDPAEFAKPENVFALLRRWLMPEDAELERAVVYAFNSVVASQWRNGRVMIAGDAAHQTPPFLGQGLCAGLRDVANLSWKLAWVIDGRAAPTLLDTYQAELAPHVTRYIAEANRIGAIIQERDPERAAARDATLRAQPQVLVPIRPRLGDAAESTTDPLAGTLAPQPRLSDGRLLDDAEPFHFVLLGRAEIVDQVEPATREIWARAKVAVLVEKAQDYLDSIAAAAVLIRPDHYILGSARTAAELDALTRAIPLAAA